ncbi:MAG: Cof-type HAD-IIB family hydrolase [Erysipelotrichaceae bacterium]|nr:Cof-type HAD-IIB family hydrolase [Erysipelotrichaceae bacterium]MDY5251735.1 HAD family hydrolase [Erysipelotrichaceae bacterium]
MKNYDFSQIKMIATDLDGTLFLPTGKPSKLTIETFNQLHQQGYLIVINSGRPLGSIAKTCKDIPYDWAIGMNGQMILNAKTKQIITNKPLYASDIYQIYAIAKKYRVVCNIHDDKQSVAIFSYRNLLYGLAYNILEYFRWIGKQKKGFKKSYYLNIQKCPIKEVGKICFAGPQKQIRALIKELNQSLPQYKCLCVSSNWLEVLDHSISKGNGLKQVLMHENLSLAQVIGFGDGENDIELLEACGYSCAMGNAMPKTIQAARQQIGTNLEDGLAKFIQKYILTK